jgi:ribose-phosphate pyrophosphokinase
MFPYLAYARHDKDKPGESLGAAWVGAIAQASGIDEVIAVDVHSDRARDLFPIPVISLSPAEIFAKALRRFSLTDATIVAPDEGAIARCEAVKKALGMTGGEIPYFAKHRTATGITHVGRISDVGRRVVIIDDILDTGGTLVSACERLREVGVEEIYVMVTHGLFTGVGAPRRSTNLLHGFGSNARRRGCKQDRTALCRSASARAIMCIGDELIDPAARHL